MTMCYSSRVILSEAKDLNFTSRREMTIAKVVAQ
jgi:hypothetical protein